MATAKVSDSHVNISPIRTLGLHLEGDIVGSATVDLLCDKYCLIEDGGRRDMTLTTYVSGGSTSDIRVKENLEPIENAMSKMSTLTGYTFDRTDIDTQRQTGLIAQDVQKVLPEAVLENSEGILSITYGNLAGIFVEAIKEQDNKIKELEHKLNTLIDKMEY